MKWKQRQPDRLPSVSAPPAPAEVEQVSALMRRRRWSEARDLTLSALERYPTNVDLLTDLVNAAYELKDMRTYQLACERLLRLTPSDPDLTLALAGAYMANLRPALAHRAFRRFLKLWPDHPRAPEARQTGEKLEAAIRANLAEQGIGGHDSPEVSALHEEAQALMEQGDGAGSRRAAEALLRRHPDFVPALNNLSQIHYLDGHVARAIATAQRALEIEPGNFHALANLVHFRLLAGRPDEARETAERLKSIESERHDLWVKTAEALSYLGDDEGVLHTFARASRAGRLDLPLMDPLFLHLVAIAALRLGREGEARRHWKRALELDPALDVARDNLADLRKPVHERHAPWPFPLATWMPERWVRELAAATRRVAERGDDRGTRQAARRYLRDRPEMAALLPLLLDRGDPAGREFALQLSVLIGSTELAAALRDFALSQRGPDDLRLQAAQVAVEHGLLPSGAVRLWAEGQWRDMILIGFEVGGAPKTRHLPPVRALVEQSMAALHASNPNRALPLLQRALELEPDAPDLQNNLAAAYEMQGRRVEALALIQQIHERHPDYLFARVSLAQVAVERRRFDEARALLTPLLSRRHLHTSEFNSLCNAFIALHVAEGNKDGARSWLALWRQAIPDNPSLSSWERRLGKSRDQLG